jgi:ABC-type transporter Mla subunit MlaD
MEAIDTQRRFEEIIAELERLKKATDLVEDNATQTKKLSEAMQKVVGALDELVPAVKKASKDSRAAVEEGAGVLQQNGDRLGGLKEDFDGFLERAASEHQNRLAQLSETLEKALAQQQQFLDQHAETQKATLQSVRDAVKEDLDRTVQSVEERFATRQEQAKTAHQSAMSSLEAMSEQELTGRRSLQEVVVHVREQVIGHANSKQEQTRQRMDDQFERGERAVFALLVLQGLTAALVLVLYFVG